MEEIIELIEEKTDLTRENLFSRKRSKDNVLCKRLFTYIALKRYFLKIDVARFLDLHHTTIMHHNESNKNDIGLYKRGYESAFIQLLKKM